MVPPTARATPNESYLFKPFPARNELDPLWTKELIESVKVEAYRVGEAFHPQKVFPNCYFRIRESLERREDLSAGAKLMRAVLEYWHRVSKGRKGGEGGSRISATRLGRELGIGRVQAYELLEELRERRLLRINPDRSFVLLEGKRQIFVPHREHGSILPASVARCSDLEMIDRMVYARLVRDCGRIGKSWITREKLAEALAINPDRAKASLRRIEKQGFIFVLRPGDRPWWRGVIQKGVGNRGAKNVYVLRWHKLLQEESEERERARLRSRSSDAEDREDDDDYDYASTPNPER